MPVPALEIDFTDPPDKVTVDFPRAAAVVDSGNVDVDLDRAAITNTTLFTTTAGVDIGTVLVTTGALPAGEYDITLVLSPGFSGTTALFDIQHRNAADASTLRSVRLNAESNRPVVVTIHAGVKLNERIRLALAGEPATGFIITATLQADRVAL